MALEPSQSGGCEVLGSSTLDNWGPQTQTWKFKSEYPGGYLGVNPRELRFLDCPVSSLVPELGGGLDLDRGEKTDFRGRKDRQRELLAHHVY